MFKSAKRKPTEDKPTAASKTQPEQELLLAGEPDTLVNTVQRIAQDNPELTVQLIKAWLKQDS